MEDPGFPGMGVPPNGSFKMETPTKYENG
jgi:hypothetical protein